MEALKIIKMIIVATMIVGCTKQIKETSAISELKDYSSTTQKIETKVVTNITKDINGIVFAIGENRPFTGKYIEHYPNQSKKLETDYKNGKEDGMVLMWYNNGKRQLEINFKDGEKNGLAISWDETGEKSEITFKNDKEDGLVTKWHLNGVKKTEMNFKNGLENGGITGWNDKGEKELEGFYKNGKLDGINTSFYSNGNKRFSISYKDGELDGKSITFYESGQKDSEGLYKNGKEDGYATKWYENGQKASEVLYKNGNKNGTQITWNENGRNRTEYEYRNGILLDKNLVGEKKSAEVVLDKKSKPKSTIEICEGYSDIAKSIMSVRQHGGNMAELMNTLSGNKLAESLIIDAYSKSGFSSEQYQDKAIKDFQNVAYLSCIKEFRK